MHQPLKSFLLQPGEGLATPPRMIQLRPTELYIHPEGDVNNNPSFTLFLNVADGSPVVLGQVSLQMVFDSLTPKARELIETHWERMKRENQ